MDNEDTSRNGEIEELKDLEDLKDLEPKGKKKQIWDLLLDGMSEETLAAEPYSYNKKTIGVVAWELDKAGLRKRPPRRRKDKSTGMAKVDRETSVATVQANVVKAETPEALVQTLDMPIDGQMIPLGQGIKIGMSMVILGVRIAQELSVVGVTQARPLVAMAKEMRAGETAAAMAASKDTAYEVANRMQDYFTPALNELGELVSQGAKPKVDTGPNPMQGMMSRIMEPMLQNLIGGMIPGGAGQTAPAGWKRIQKTRIKEDKADDARSRKDDASPEGDRED